jgi:hypothetical protein
MRALNFNPLRALGRWLIPLLLALCFVALSGCAGQRREPAQPVAATITLTPSLETNPCLRGLLPLEGETVSLGDLGDVLIESEVFGACSSAWGESLVGVVRGHNSAQQARSH